MGASQGSGVTYGYDSRNVGSDFMDGHFAPGCSIASYTINKDSAPYAYSTSFCNGAQTGLISGAMGGTAWAGGAGVLPGAAAGALTGGVANVVSTFQDRNPQ